MELKKNIIYFYTVQKQLQIPIYRYMYNICSIIIDLFETKKYKKKCYHDNDINYTLFTSSLKRIQKLHILLEDFNSFRFIFIDGIYYNTLIKVNLLYERFIYIPSGLFLNNPIEILYVYTGTYNKSILFYIKNLIILGKGSCVKIIEHHNNLCLKKEKFSSVTKIYMNSYSFLNFYKINSNKLITSLINQTSILQEYRSECNINTFSFFGKSMINFLSIYQLGKEIHSHINGLSIFQEYINHNTLIEHIYPNGKSSDVYKGIFNKVSNTYFNSKICILKEGKKTTAIQNSSSILLTNECKVNTNPKLEIFSDDVKCSHGCIVGQLNTEEIFYLQSRGITKSEAINKLLVAFAKEILEFISFEELKNIIKKNIYKNIT